MDDKPEITKCIADDLGEGIWFLRILGPLGWGLGESLYGCLEKVRISNGRGVLIDLSDAGSLDGSGLIQLYRAACYLEREKLRVAVWGCDGFSLDVLTHLDLSAKFPLFSKRENAELALNVGKNVSGNKGNISSTCLVDQWNKAWCAVQPNELPPNTSGLNVVGRDIQGPFEGCGKLVLKRYRLQLGTLGKSLEDLAESVKSRLSDLWPPGNTISFSPGGISAGKVGVIQLTMPGRMPLTTGVRVIYDGPRSFTFATLRGHLASGLIDFSFRQQKHGSLFEISSLARTGDKVFDIGFRLFGHVQQEHFWNETLVNAASFLGVPACIDVVKEFVDVEEGACKSGNLFNNAAALTMLGTIISPLAALRRSKRHKGASDG